ncbi:MAG: ATP-binding cassette domain-containing protein, partial [Rhodococcus sp. (in: high G+C Gram-positive bacteria)]|nr:ATP-binding cassette domain-containing protein [Rhodococcus sp. (in: high G+C Gram-positive bacteria)]
FTIRQGERIALVGESGSGKSTLLHVLMGLLAHQGVVEHGHDRVRQELGVVLPGMSLHVGTVRGNLTGSDDDFPDSKIWAALDAVGLAEIVYSLPRGLDSAVLESGRNFSSGQAQRLLVAKSLIRGRSGVFWDEALSGLDPHTRVRTYERVILSDDWRQTSMIIVSHQMDILAHVDRVIYLDGEGGAPTIGTAHELEQSNPRYRAFVAETHALRP